MSYRLSPAARADLRSIWFYTKDRWDSAQADRYVLSIRTACEHLSAGTVRGRSAEVFLPGYMQTNAGSHIIFYKVLRPGSIDVIRILHPKMDILSRLTGKPN